jgi:hypothetical protein
MDRSRLVVRSAPASVLRAHMVGSTQQEKFRIGTLDVAHDRDRQLSRAVAQYHADMGIIDKDPANAYRYMNFDQIEQTQRPRGRSKP